MDVTTAVEHLNSITLWPEWKLIASDYTKRHESAIMIRLEYTVRNSDAPLAPDYDQWVTPAYGEWAIMVGDVTDTNELYARAFAVVLGAVEHELREFFGTTTTHTPDKPFHPHTLSGMAAWQQWNHVARPTYANTITSDITFGSV